MFVFFCSATFVVTVKITVVTLSQRWEEILHFLNSLSLGRRSWSTCSFPRLSLTSLQRNCRSHDFLPWARTTFLPIYFVWLQCHWSELSSAYPCIKWSHSTRELSCRSTFPSTTTFPYRDLDAVFRSTVEMFDLNSCIFVEVSWHHQWSLRIVPQVCRTTFSNTPYHRCKSSTLFLRVQSNTTYSICVMLYLPHGNISRHIEPLWDVLPLHNASKISFSILSHNALFPNIIEVVVGQNCDFFHWSPLG